MKMSKKLSLSIVLLYCLAMLSGCCTLFPKLPNCPPIMAIDTTSLDFGTDKNSMIFSITNKGGKTLTWNASTEETWITLSPPGDSTNSETDQVVVSVDRSAVASGTHNGTVQVSSNDGDFIVVISMAKPEPEPEPEPEPVENPRRKISISGTIQLLNDETFGSDHTASASFNRIVFINDAQTLVLEKVPPPKPCAGREVWIALDITVKRINTEGDISISIDGRLYEGKRWNECEDEDLDGTYSTTFNVLKNTTEITSFTIMNTEERWSDDKADITLTIYNGPDL